LDGSQGYLTTHVLDTARGRPAAGMKIELYRLDAGGRTHLAEAETNDDGRTDSPILPKGRVEVGRYELVFHAGAYLDRIAPSGTLRFLDEIPIRFGIDNVSAHYHVPLLLSPFSYATYRGS